MRLRKQAPVALLAMVAGVGLLAAGAQAGSLVLGNSGWTASWDASLDSRLGLNVEAETANSVFVEKFATFTDANAMDITFTRTAGVSALPFIVINDEMVVNQTGQDWTSFRFTLAPSSGGLAFDAGQTAISPPGSGFSIDPFSASAYSAGNTVLDVSGGTVSAVLGSNVWMPGVRSGGLAINSGGANGPASFVLSEQPGNIIPLPAAAWSGLSGLLGLGLIGSRKQLRKLFR